MSVQDEVPKSRLTLTYRTEIHGEPETVNLPLRLLVMGDMSLGTSADRKVDFEERRIRAIEGSNLDAMMKDMKMALDFVVANKVDPQKSEEMRVNLPIQGMKSFTPDEIIKNVPKLRALMLLKKLLLEVESNVANKKELRNLLASLFANEAAFKKVVEELKGFESFSLPTAQDASRALPPGKA